MKKSIVSVFVLALFANGVFAEIPINKEDLLKTTLTELNKTDQTTYPNKSSYQLEENTDTTGNFVITKYWNDNGTITPVNYNVKFTDVLGDENGDTTYYYKWGSTDEGNRILEQTDATSYNIIAKVNSADNKRIDTDQQGADISHSFIANNRYDGGAIYNRGTIGDITGDFIGNYVSFTWDSITNIKGVIVSGGAISSFDYSTINSITGDFIGNYASVTGSISQAGARGGAIEVCVYGWVTSIIGDFIGNYISAFSSALEGECFVSGGAISNAGIISSITGDFIGNYISDRGSKSSSLKGGAIYNGCRITIREGSSFTGNYITTDGGVTKTFEAIYNADTINFNVYDTSKSIIVNDGINGDAKYKTSQILNINQVSDAGVYGTVEFNSFVNNQTVNVLNGILKLGSFAGATLDVNGTELIVPETKALLTNTDINIKSGAELLIDANVRFSSNSSISMELGGVIKINSGANLTLDETFTFSVNLGSIVGDFELNLIQVNDATALADLLATLKSEDTTSVFSNEQKVYGWTLYQGTGDYSSWIVLSGTVAVPEPAEWAVIFGAVALGFVAYRKRK